VGGLLLGMSELDFGEGVESSLLNESLALKAFLRLKREERRRNGVNLSSQSFLTGSNTVTLREKERTRDRSHFSVSYDPENISMTHRDSPTQRLSMDSLIVSNEREREDPEERKGLSEENSRTFSSMHSIINESFQEKIDYQRKLRDQQSELFALKEKLHQIQIENNRLIQSTIKLKQRQLPLAFSHLMKMRRRSKV
jgi:hypothetical protein